MIDMEFWQALFKTLHPCGRDFWTGSDCQPEQSLQSCEILERRIRHLRPNEVQLFQPLERRQLFQSGIPHLRVAKVQRMQSFQSGQLLDPGVSDPSAAQV